MFCQGCGAPHVAGDLFCQQCGLAYSMSGPATGSQLGVSDLTGDPQAATVGRRRLGNTGGSSSPNWAPWAIGIAVIVALVMFLSLAASSRSGGILGGGGCRGGVEQFGVPSYQSTDGKHWTAIVPCNLGGSKTRPATKSETRWLNR